MDSIKYEDKDLCRKCGGFCCKKGGCMYFVSDFNPFNKETIVRALETGNVSIRASLDFKWVNGKDVAIPFLYLGPRNVDRGVVDLFSFKKQCSMLTDTGCSYDLKDRPSGAVNLIPHMNELTGEFDCEPIVDLDMKLKEYITYQDLLRKMVKRYSGASVMQKLSEDMETLFYQIFTNDFDGILEEEVVSIIQGIDKLVGAFPLEFERAKNRYDNSIGMLYNSNGIDKLKVKRHNRGKKSN